MLAVVRHKLDISLSDFVLVTAWRVMWDLTDEASRNSQWFVDLHGMELFLRCMETFPEDLDLLRNMLGVVGNIAEVSTCRCRLMTKAYIKKLTLLLRDGVAFSYPAAGVLAHMASDGPAAWTIQKPSRDDVLKRLARAVNSWDTKRERLQIKFRSLGPFIELLETEHTIECQIFATWTIANLTKVKGDKYCPMVEKDGLSRIRANIKKISSSAASMRQGQEERLLVLSQQVIVNMEDWNNRLFTRVSCQ